MAARNNDDGIFTDQTKLKYNKNVLKLVEAVLSKLETINQEQIRWLGCNRNDNSILYDIRLKAFGTTPVPPRQDPSELRFEGNSNGERTLFKSGPTVTLTYENEGNLLKPPDATSDHLNLPDANLLQPPNATSGKFSEADFPLRQNSFKMDLKVSVDKKITLTFSSKSEIEIPGVKCRMKKREKYYRYVHEWKLEMGAKKIIYFNNEKPSEYLEVLRIKNQQEYEEELYIRGQIGAFEFKEGRRRKEDRGNIETFNTFVRFIQFGNAIFKVDFYDFYIYYIVGVVQNQNSEDSTSKMYYAPVVSNNPTNRADYKSLIDEIDTEAAVKEFLKIFSFAINGNFCGFNSDKERIMQLCLALIYAEPIRNFQAIGWNKLILDHAKYIVSDRDLRDVLKNHPMVTGGSFKGRLTGYYGTTEAASSKVAAFKLKLNKLKDDFDTIGLPERQQNDDDNQDLPVSYRS